MLFLVGLLLAFFVFVSLISINLGLMNFQKEGFWVPILAGTLVIFICLWLFFVVSRFIIRRMKEKHFIKNM